jgi:starch-binding outer membrane protein, SusD/RagB family
MNKSFFIKLSAICFVTLSVAACTDLKVQEVDSFAPAAGATAFDPAKLLASAYEDLGVFTDQANVYSLTTHTGDEMIPPTRGTDWGDNGVWRTLDEHTWNSSHSNVLSAWNDLNGRAYKCNQILAATAPAPTASQKAQAQFLRALYMSQIMDLFGQVPFRETTQGVKDLPSVKSRADAYAFIVKDLTEALPNLDASPINATNGKASKAAANALLARLALNKAVYTASASAGPYTFAKADMDQVIAYCNAVETAGYSLESSYFTNFTKAATKEVIMTTGGNGSPENRWRMTLHYNQNPDGWNGFTTLADFYDKFEDKDQRKGTPAKKDGTNYSGIGRGFLIGQQFDDKGVAIIEKRGNTPLIFTREIPLSGANVKNGIRVIKYHPADAGQYILLRYAEVLLTKAEAQFRSGDAAAALVTINLLRTSRGATPFTALTEANILDERGRELYWEGGRRTDLVRFGKFTSSTGVTKKDAYTVLFPIPLNAILSNPNLKQNEGY